MLFAFYKSYYSTKICKDFLNISAVKNRSSSKSNIIV